LKPGSRIISFDFDMAGAKPYEVFRGKEGELRYRTIYKWIVPWQEETPEPDTEKETHNSNFGTVKLSGGFSPDPHKAKGASGGNNLASALQADCTGWLATTPDHILELSTPFEYLRIFTQSAGDTALVIKMPNGKFRCNDNTHGHNPLLEGSWPIGVYQIWVASDKKDDMHEYEIKFTTNKSAIPTSIPVKPAKSRSISGSSVDRSPDVVFVPTPQLAVDKMLELANIQPGDVLYDLGCGDGRIVVTAAKKYGIKAVGFDIDPQRIKESQENVKKAGVEHLVTIKHADIFTLDLSPANVITLYLLPSLNVKLKPQLRKLKPGSRIVSFDFNMSGAKPAEVYKGNFGTNYQRVIYKWVVPWQEQQEPTETDIPTQSSNFGTVKLNKSFSPDPHTTQGTSGGGIQASSFHADCSGWVASTPDHLLELPETLDFLKIFAQSSGNTTLVIKMPDGKYRCNDDTYEHNPALHGSWEQGTYKIWLGSFKQGEMHSYKLMFTTNKDLKPQK
jgi:SAM-dependent methyltransferase